MQLSPSNKSMPSFDPSMSEMNSQYEIDKKKYGALLPKSGVYFLPDERIVAFLKVLNEMRKRFESV